MEKNGLTVLLILTDCSASGEGEMTAYVPCDDDGNIRAPTNAEKWLIKTEDNAANWFLAFITEGHIDKALDHYQHIQNHDGAPNDMNNASSYGPWRHIKEYYNYFRTHRCIQYVRLYFDYK